MDYYLLPILCILCMYCLLNKNLLNSFPIILESRIIYEIPFFFLQYGNALILMLKDVNKSLMKFNFLLLFKDDFFIFTDIDGTLLDHVNYSYGNLKNYIHRIKNNASIIFNTSKTFEEIQILNNNLELNYPFIVENGACIFFPQDYLTAKIKMIIILDTKTISVINLLVLIL